MSSINSEKKRKRNPHNAGRKPKPQTKFKFDLENLEDTERDLRNLCQDDGTKDIVLELVCQMRKEISDSHTQETQTLYDVKDEETQTDISPLETVLSILPTISYDDLLYLFHNLFHNMEDTDKVVQLFSLFSNLENENQEVFMESLGGLFNPEILKATVATPNTSTVTLNVNKSDFISECDPWLKAILT